MKINNFADVLVDYRDDATGAMGARMYHRTGADEGFWGADAGVSVRLVKALSNNGQVALQVVDGTAYGLACRWTPLTGELEPIRNGKYETVAYGINDTGTVCGYTRANPFRYAGALEVLFGIGEDGGGAHGINSSGDLICWTGSYGPHSSLKVYVYQDTLESFYDVDSLIDPNNDPTDAAIWSTRTRVAPVHITNRIGTTNFGQLIGWLTNADGIQWGYLLTPKLPAPPVVESLTDSPDPVKRGQNLTLTAHGVSDPDGVITQVAFYRDNNGNGQPDSGELLGTDTDGSDGWSLTFRIPNNFATGTYTYLAQATSDSGLTSNVVSTENTVVRK